MILKNAKPEHAVSKPTPRQSAQRQHQVRAKPTVASSLFKSRVLNPVHLNQVSKENDNVSNVKEANSGFHEEDKESVALNAGKSAEKHRKKKNENEVYQYGYQYEEAHYHGVQQKPYQHKHGSEPQPSKSNVKSVRSSDLSPLGSDDDFINLRIIKYKVRNILIYASIVASSTSDHSQHSKKPPPIPPKPQQILITKNNSLNTKAQVTERTKDLRLKGSDLYVARLGNCHATPPVQHRAHTSQIAAPPTPSSKSEPSSLYDELSALSRTPSPTVVPTKPPKKPEIRASRPCYRCVSAMHAVGIKRVFWTNANGEWEGAKVRDLVEALEKGIGDDDAEGLGTGQENKGVFVTKHEVLMLKRIMGF